MPAMPRWLEHRIPPPLIDLAVAALMWALACLWPLAQLWPRGGRPWVLGAALGLAAFAARLVYQRGLSDEA